MSIETIKSATVSLLRRFGRDEQGATAIEYGLIVCLIAVAAIPAMNAVSGANGGSWDNVAAQVIANSNG